MVGQLAGSGGARPYRCPSAAGAERESGRCQTGWRQRVRDARRSRSRLYFARQGKVVVVLLCGGDKRTQARDIAKAKQMIKEI